jgi:plasmid stability protein
MASLLIRKLDDALHARLKARALQHGRSLEEEVRETLRLALARDASVQEPGHRQLRGWPACEMELSRVAGRDDTVRCSQLRRLPFPG